MTRPNEDAALAISPPINKYTPGANLSTNPSFNSNPKPSSKAAAEEELGELLLQLLSFHFHLLRRPPQIEKKNMSRSISGAKALSSFISNEISAVAARRGYAAPPHGAVSGVAPNVMLKKGGSDESRKTTAWVPDPKTGYYRPENANTGGGQDPAELREVLVNNKTGGH